MSSTLRALAIAAVLIAQVALAKPLEGQGRSCDAQNKCDAGLQCVPHPGGKARCELICTSSSKCPEDQRCVKDGSQMVCRPINDGVGL
jgi:hypothetical protein